MALVAVRPVFGVRRSVHALRLGVVEGRGAVVAAGEVGSVGAALFAILGPAISALDAPIQPVLVDLSVGFLSASGVAGDIGRVRFQAAAAATATATGAMIEVVDIGDGALTGVERYAGLVTQAAAR